MAFSSGPPPRPLGIPKPPTVNRAAPVNQGPPVNHGPPVNQGPPINFQYLEPEPECISSWSTVFWIAVVLLLAVPILFNYDPLKGVLDINSMERETSSENALLAVEKDKSRHEREAMAQERELWEKARDARVPPGAFWDVVWPAWDCRAYGKREYWGSLRNIPNGWDAIDACMNMPVEIKGVKVRRPDRCARVFVFPEVQIHGYWMVDWDQPDCKPWYRDFEDKVRRPKIRPFVPSGCSPSNRDAPVPTPENVKSKPRSWVSTTRENKTGGGCVAPCLWSGT